MIIELFGFKLTVERLVKIKITEDVSSIENIHCCYVYREKDKKIIAEADDLYWDKSRNEMVELRP